MKYYRRSSIDGVDGRRGVDEEKREERGNERMREGMRKEG
jgi:hypothetical protein